MQIWYLSPFLLALLVWWVATRRHPEDKEKWTWLALGVCGGTVLMFGLTFFSEHRVTGAGPTEVRSNETIVPKGTEPRVTLQGDRVVEVLAPVRLRNGRTLALGSLQITLLEVNRPTAILQIEPRDELAFLSGRKWTYTSTTSYKPDTSEPATSVMRTGVEVTLGEHVDFGYRGNIYRLSLLQLPRPLLEYVPADAADAFGSHAVIRVIQRGTYGSMQGDSQISPNTKPKVKGEGVTQQTAPEALPRGRSVSGPRH